MHAFLATAASHLHSLLPGRWGSAYHRIELKHLCKSLQLFRKALETPDNPIHSLVACSVLLLHHSWKSGFIHNDSEEQDSLLPLASGVQKIIWKVKKNLDPAFIDLWRICGPNGTVISYANGTDVPQELETEMISQYNKLRHCACTSEDDWAFLSAARNMIPVLAFLQLKSSSKPHHTKDIESDAEAYLFHWPAKSEEELKRLSQNHYDATQLLFLYYYDAASKLFPQNCWWAKMRSEALCRDIGRRLKGKCDSELVERFSMNDSMEHGAGKDSEAEND